MNEFLGIPMAAVAVALLALLAAVPGIVGFARFRQPILFEIGVRNIPRGRAQSILIVLGLTTVIPSRQASGIPPAEESRYE